MCSLRQRLASPKGPTSRPMAYTFGSSTFAMGLHWWKVRGRVNNVAPCFDGSAYPLRRPSGNNMSYRILGDLEKIHFRPPFCHGPGIAQTKSGLSL